MKNNNLNSIWMEIEANKSQSNRFLQRMVYVHLLWRAYIGCSGIPSRRFLSLEIPSDRKNEFSSFIVPQGFTLSIGKPSVDHDGYVACILQATSSDQNDVFAVVAQDILEELSKQSDVGKYISVLKNRIIKWRDFFKNPSGNKLSNKAVIGLIGELTFIKKMHGVGIDIISDLWNGPIKASQDFQGIHTAFEVKTSGMHSLDYVHISSEEQLDDGNWNALFLIVYRVERNDAAENMLPVLIENVAKLLSEQQKLNYYAKLTCLGYSRKDKALYNKGYIIKEQKAYIIKKGFPRVLKADLPQGINNISYQLALQNCEKYVSSQDDIAAAIKEYEYGEN